MHFMGVVIAHAEPEDVYYYQEILNGFAGLTKIVGGTTGPGTLASTIATNAVMANWLLGHLQAVLNTVYIQYTSASYESVAQGVINSASAIVNLVDYATDLVGTYAGLSFKHGVLLGAAAPKVGSRLMRIGFFCFNLLTAISFIKAILASRQTKTVETDSGDEDEDESGSDSDEETSLREQAPTQGRSQVAAAALGITSDSIDARALLKAMGLAKGLLGAFNAN